MKAKELWLTHYGPATPEPEQFEAERKGIFDNTVIARDGQTVILQFRDSWEDICMEFVDVIVRFFLAFGFLWLLGFLLRLSEVRGKETRKNDVRETVTPERLETPVPGQPKKQPQEIKPLQQPSIPEYPTSGSCGENLTWRKEGNVLYIEGIGELDTYWEKWCEIQEGFPYGIHKIVIGSGCTAIGEDAFGRGSESICENWTNLVSVEIPETVTAIGDHAFWCCDELESIQLPSSLVAIGAGAFAECASLTEIEIPDQITVIDDSAFYDCESLCSVTLPDALKGIRHYAFSGCRSLTTLVIPDSVTEIGECAFKDVPCIYYKGPAQSDNNWGADEWCRSEPERKLQTVALHCRTCGTLHNRPLTIDMESSFDGAEIAAYGRGICWNQQVPVPGAHLEITVNAPFCCAVGNTFWAAYDKRFVQARLISILSMEEQEARILAEVLQTKDRLSFVRPVSEEVKSRLREQHSYDYHAPGGDAPNPQVRQEEAGIRHFSNSYGGGDICYDDYIYTDADGIDHRIMSRYSDFEGSYTFVGDEVLGFREDSPYQWENGLLIDWKSKTVIECAADATEVVIPQGIVRLGWFVFWNHSRLERITIPDSVTSIYNAFLDSPKEVILTGHSPLTENNLSQIRGAKIRHIP